MAAAIAGGGDAPEDQDAEHHAADIEGIGNVVAERVAQDHGKKDVECDDADKGGRDPFDGVDEPVHPRATHGGSEGLVEDDRKRRGGDPPRLVTGSDYSASALCFFS